MHCVRCNISHNAQGGVGTIGSFEDCIIVEELAFGCTGIATAITVTGLGVSEYNIALISIGLIGVIKHMCILYLFIYL